MIQKTRDSKNCSYFIEEGDGDKDQERREQRKLLREFGEDD